MFAWRGFQKCGRDTPGGVFSAVLDLRLRQHYRLSPRCGVPKGYYKATFLAQKRDELRTEDINHINNLDMI